MVCRGVLHQRWLLRLGARAVNIHDLTHWAVCVDRKPCLGNPCDGSDRCKRHEQTPAIVARLARMKAKKEGKR